MSATHSEQGQSPAGRNATAVTLALSLVASAFLMALSLSSPDYSYLGWLTLLPLFFAIRVLRPLRALLSGGLWGLCLFIFSVTVFDTGVAGSLPSLALMTVVPALYACLGARLTRWIGFSPFVLGVSWMGVELALEPLGLHNGLLAATQGDGPLLHWVGGALGYVLAAFIVAFVSAALVSVLSRVRLAIPRPRYLTGPGAGPARLVPQTFSCFPLFAIPVSQPRGPPAEPGEPWAGLLMGSVTRDVLQHNMTVI